MDLLHKSEDSQLVVLLSIRVSSILLHGYIHKSITESVIVPVFKDKNRRVNQKGSYRPICLSNICSKIIDAVLFNRTDTYLQTTYSTERIRTYKLLIQQNGYVLTNYLFNRTDTYLQTTPHQFGFKPTLGTELRVFAFKEQLKFYTKLFSWCFKKALNRVNRHKLLKKLEQRGVPKYIIRVLSNEFHNQCVCVRWGAVYSDFFSVGNGVKQGGKLSPLLFYIYMDNLRAQLHKQPIGCSIGTTVVNHLTYTDDLLLFAPP